MTALLSTGAQSQAVSSNLDGYASFGATFGVMKWVFDVDVADESRIRPVMKAVFRYRFSRKMILVGESGFGWNDYPKPIDEVTVVFPTTFGFLRHLREQWGTAIYYGGGAGIYYWDNKRNGRSNRDAWTDNQLKGFEPGFYLSLESEKQITDHVTLTLTFQNHYIISTHGDDFPAAFGDDDDYVSLRMGFHYHWSPQKGIIWGTSDPQEPGINP
ncbi:MAG: hypothetical protein KJ970_08890 [Candidatus Eisenbacteria bacterium]|uniref:Uncharacterized protein n=1 Tax=Eiseniibacteriota bacterium TaxID=2212470 RepID=A0A948RXS4_UNCEI|nr:hypothetical protein [Candidatus Eisenbacteria bacterium]